MQHVGHDVGTKRMGDENSLLATVGLNTIGNALRNAIYAAGLHVRHTMGYQSVVWSLVPPKGANRVINKIFYVAELTRLYCVFQVHAGQLYCACL